MADWYQVTGWPGQGSAGESAPARSELLAIQTALNKLPVLTGRQNRAVFVNPSGTGLVSITASDARTHLGGTTVGQSFFTMTNPGAISFPRINADNTVTALSAADFRASIGATTVGNAFMTLANPSAVSFPRINADNSVSSLSATDMLTALGGTVVGKGIFALASPGAVSLIRINANNSVEAVLASQIKSDLDLGTMSEQDADDVDIEGGTIENTSVLPRYKAVSIVSGVLTINVSEASVFYVSVNQNFVVLITGRPADTLQPVPFRVVCTSSGAYEVTSLSNGGITAYGSNDINLKPSGRTILDCMITGTIVDVTCYQMDVVP